MSVLAIDAGTTGVTALVVDETGAVVARGYEEFPQHFPQPGWVEHEPEQIWQATLSACRQAMRNDHGRSITAVGLTNQRETAVLWDRESLAAPRRAVVWQDRRSAGVCDRLREAGHEDRVRELTGLRFDPYFTGTKLTWLAENDPSAWAGVTDGADDHRAVPDPGPGARVVLGEPGELGAGEVRVEAQAGELTHPVLVAGLAQPVADVAGTPVLPHHRTARSGERGPVPEHRRLALVGESDGGHGLPGQRLAAGGQRRLPDLLRLVLHPARPREVLRELLVAAGDHAAALVDDQSRHTGRAGVDRKDGHG